MFDVFGQIHYIVPDLQCVKLPHSMLYHMLFLGKLSTGKLICTYSQNSFIQIFVGSLTNLYQKCLEFMYVLNIFHD